MVLFPREYNISKVTDGTFVKGKFIPGTPIDTTFQADIQPLTNKETESLSIGKRELGKVKIYTDEVLTTLTPEKTNGDRVEFNSGIYEVISKDKHEVGIIPHEKYIAEFRGNV